MLQACGTTALLALAGPGVAVAQPSGAAVIAGQASVSAPSGATTIITQTSQKAIINWQNFSVGASATVQFNQPDNASLTLNRVVGNTLSTVDGAIKANGQVWLINPNGVLFGNGAMVNVGGLLATTADIANNDFMSGNYAFTGSPAGSAIVNRGAINSATGGSVVLSAARVANKGVIVANTGHVVLGGSDSFTVDFKGDHLLSYAVTAPAHGADAGVSNEGIIKAPGGQVLVTARAADRIADGVVNNSGIVEATSAHAENGEIILDAGDGGAVNSGTLDASGKNAGETGGTIKVLGNSVTIADNATIDVSGDAGGGSAMIGGDLHGAGPDANAQTVTLGKATLKADAITRGNGGTVAIYSTGTTKVAAAISARGGSQSGNGGQIETSGHDLQVADVTTVTTSAANGAAGDWLLDPKNIIINSTGTDSAAGQTFNTIGNTATIDPSTINAALTGGNVTLQANTDITVSSTLNVTANTANTLTLQAGRTIALTNGAAINYAAGNLALFANDPGATAGDRTAGAAFIESDSTGGVSAARVDLTLYSNGSDGSLIGASSFAPFLVTGGSPTYVDTAGANVYLTGGNGVATSFTLGNSAHARAVDIGTGSLGLTAGGVTQVAPIFLNNFSLSLPASTSSGNPVLLTDTGNAITGTVNINVMGGSPFSGTDYVKIVNSQALTVGTISDTPNIVGGNGDRGSLTLQTTSGDLTLTGNIDASQISLISAGAVIQNGGRIDSHIASSNNNLAGSVTLNAGTTISLTNANNVIEQTVAGTGNGSETAVTNDGQISITSGGAASITVASRVDLNAASAGGALTLNVTGSYNLSDAGGNFVTTYNEIDIFNPVTAAGLLTLHASGSILSQFSSARDVHLTAGAGLSATSDNGALALGDLGHASIGGGPVDIGNQVSGAITLVAGGGDAFFLNNVNFATHLGGSSSAAGSLSVLSNTDLVVDPGATITSALTSGDAVVLAPLGNFVNNSGSGAVQVQSGARWLIYSAAPTNDVFGNLNSNNTAIWNWNSTIPFPISASGNRYVFATPATLTIAATSQIKTYGTDVSASIAGGYTISGLQPDVTNAYLGDTAAVYSGTPTLSTSGAGASAAVAGSPYAITIGQGSFAATNGYNVTLQNGAITVNPATLTYTAASASRIYGAANPAFSGTVTGFVNGETQASATTGIASFTTPATTGSTVGSYAINGTGLAAANYTFQQAAGNATSLSISQATLTYVANAASKTYGAANPALGGAVTGFVNGDTQSGATTGTLSFTTPATMSSGVGIYAINGSGLSAINYNFLQAAGNATALTINAALLTYSAGTVSRTYGGANPAFGGTVTGFVNGDTQAGATTGTLNFISPATSASSAGSYAINGSGLAAANYIFQQATGNATALTINKATLTYTASGTSRAYGAANPTFGGSVTGFVNNETQSGATTGTLSFTSPATTNSVVGSYAINGSGLSATNYNFLQAAGNATALSVVQAAILYVATPVSRTYGTANPAITGTVTGFANGDTQSSTTTGTASFATTAIAASGVGSYAITGSGLTVTNSNYVLQQAAGNITALIINPAILTYTANSATRVYGAANPTFSGTVSGFVNNDTQSSATTGTLSFTTQAGAASGVGSYAINGSGLATGNYVFQQAAANATALAITPKALTVALQGTVSKVFDGTTAATLTSVNYNVQGLVGTDTVALAGLPTSGTYDTADISTGKIVTVAGTVLSNPNYTLLNSIDPAAIGVIIAGVGGTGSVIQNLQVLATTVANQNNAVIEPTRPGTVYLDLGTSTAAQEANPAVTASVPIAATLTPTSVGPIAELVSNNGNASGNASVEPPTPADQASNFLAASLEGSSILHRAGIGTIIPGLLRSSANPRGTGNDKDSTDDYSGWGNPALWQK